MAEAIAQGIKEADARVNIKLFNTARRDKNDIITEVFKSKAILVGSPTINKGILFSIAGIMEEIKGMGFKNKKAAAFGTYGWSGESTALIMEKLKECGFGVTNEGLKVFWNPDDKAISDSVAFGTQFVREI